MPQQCAESGCINDTDAGLCQDCANELKYGTSSRNYTADGQRVELRDSESTDDDSHAGVVAAQLAEADAETRADLEEGDR